MSIARFVAYVLLWTSVFAAADDRHARATRVGAGLTALTAAWLLIERVI